MQKRLNFTSKLLIPIAVVVAPEVPLGMERQFSKASFLSKNLDKHSCASAEHYNLSHIATLKIDKHQAGERIDRNVTNST